MSVLCCGYERDTPVCPLCGAKVNEVPLLELLNYLRSTAGSKRTSSKNYVEGTVALMAKPDTTEKAMEILQKRIDRSNAKVLKWDTWVEALEEVVEKEQ